MYYFSDHFLVLFAFKFQVLIILVLVASIRAFFKQLLVFAHFGELCGVKFARYMLCFHFLLRLYLRFWLMGILYIYIFYFTVFKCVLHLKVPIWYKLSKCFEVESSWSQHLVVEGLLHSIYVGYIQVFVLMIYILSDAGRVKTCSLPLPASCYLCANFYGWG